MKNFMRRLFRVAAFMVCVPFMGTMFVKPERAVPDREKYDTYAMDSRFSVRVDEEIGSFFYAPEAFTELMVYRMVPRDIEFSASEDYVEASGAAQDPEQEYLKALSVVCRSDIISSWETQGCPDILEYDSMRLGRVSFCDIPEDDTKFLEIKRAASATRGAVITDEDGTATVPFFTSAPSDILVSQAGDGAGVSVNFSYELARQGMSFYEILKYFLGDVKVNICE